ncbi:MAG: alpha-mannosidase, partial [bacterium]
MTLTSYNEWGEGTQIEPARSHTSVNGSVYADYSPLPPDFYLQRTRAWVEEARRGCKG